MGRAACVTWVTSQQELSLILISPKLAALACAQLEIAPASVTCCGLLLCLRDHIKCLPPKEAGMIVPRPQHEACPCTSLSIKGTDLNGKGRRKGRKRRDEERERTEGERNGKEERRGEMVRRRDTGKREDRGEEANGGGGGGEMELPLALILYLTSDDLLPPPL